MRLIDPLNPKSRTRQNYESSATTSRHFYLLAKVVEKQTQEKLAYFFKMSQPWPLFHLFSSFCTNLVASRIRTWIVGVEDEDADH